MATRRKGTSPKKDSTANLVFDAQLLACEANFDKETADTALRACAFPQREAKPQVMREARDNFRKDDEVSCQQSGATSTPPQGCPKGERGGVNQFGVPPKGNTNFAWVQHFIHYLAPQGIAGFVLANGSMSSNQSGKGYIRKALIEADLIIRSN